ncbi:ASCH domain-containing protein, partial [Candidatus Pacearchaeota archaeon]|nr:ASCH domain-containing protein [Candidatus Pacearchaeota archaeon]
MKAISIKEPWASLIDKGKKTIETRTWKTKYRGKLLLCCSMKPFISNLCGMAFSTCELVDIRLMTRQDEYKARCKKYDGAYS